MVSIKHPYVPYLNFTGELMRNNRHSLYTFFFSNYSVFSKISSEHNFVLLIILEILRFLRLEGRIQLFKHNNVTGILSNHNK